jgi:hypothetical protein
MCGLRDISGLRQLSNLSLSIELTARVDEVTVFSLVRKIPSCSFMALQLGV